MKKYIILAVLGLGLTTISCEPTDLVGYEHPTQQEFTTPEWLRGDWNRGVDAYYVHHNFVHQMLDNVSSMETYNGYNSEVLENNESVFKINTDDGIYTFKRISTEQIEVNGLIFNRFYY